MFPEAEPEPEAIKMNFPFWEIIAVDDCVMFWLVIVSETVFDVVLIIYILFSM